MTRSTDSSTIRPSRNDKVGDSTRLNGAKDPALIIEGVLDAGDEVSGIVGFEDEAFDAELAQGVHVRFVPEAGGDEDADVGVHLKQAAGKRAAVGAGHYQVGDHEGDPVAFRLKNTPPDAPTVGYSAPVMAEVRSCAIAADNTHTK